MTPRDVLHYRITGELGQGAMGEVFRATDQRLGREVALKMLPADVAGDPGWETRMLREAQAASALNHPGIVTLHGIESAEGRTFLVMELVHGDRFADLATRRCPWQRALALVADVADALAVAHAKNILHRDIKSDNLMVTPSGQVKVLDFGLAKLRALPEVDPAAVNPAASVRLATAAHARGALTSDLTQAGQLVGTPAYMAPECYEGLADVRSDVFALGVVLYELLVGIRPFDRENPTATMGAILLDEPVAPSKAAADREIPERVDAIVAKAIAKLPEDRFADMHAMKVAIREALRPRARRWPWLAAAAGVLGVGATMWFVIPRGSGSHAIPIALTSSRRLTLDPGCEEYPQLHPDGRRVVYDGLIGDDYEILIRDIDGTDRRNLSATPGWDYAAALSPDGTLVAYVHEDIAGRVVRVAHVDGAPAARDIASTTGYPSWSGNDALLVGDSAGRIVRRELLGGRETVLGQLPAGARPYHIVDIAGAGTAVLWWTSSEANASALGEIDRSGALVVIEESVTSYEGGLAASSSTPGYYATRKGALNDNQLMFRAWGGAAPVVVPGGLAPGAGLDVSADGHRLVFSTCIERQHIAHLRSDRPVEMVSNGEWQDGTPFAFDATHAVITSDRLGHQNGWLIDLAGIEPPRVVTPPGALAASPSLDGTSVVYVAAGGRGGLAIVATAGGTARQLTTDPSDAAPVFSHDGKHIVFERTVAGATVLHVIDTTGGTARPIGAGAQPAASPVDDTIAFVATTDASGARRVMLTDLAGAPPRALAHLEPATWQRPRFSPDGTQLLLLRGFRQVVTIALAGGPASIVFSATTGSVNAADWARDGDGILAGIGAYDGDLWLADGTFP